MSLRKQLLAFSLLTLLLPWAGFRYVQEMEAALRSGLEQSLLASATTVAQALENQGALSGAQSELGGNDAESVLYAQTLASAPRIDGSRDDWNLAEDLARNLGTSARFWLGIEGPFVYAFVEVTDSNVVYQRAARQSPYGDRVVLLTEPGHGMEHWLVFSTSAPGILRAQRTSPPLFIPDGDYDDRVLSSWREAPGGFRVEIRLPLRLVGQSLGLASVDVDAGPDGYSVALATTWGPGSSRPGAFVFQRPGLQRVVRQFSGREDRFRVIDRQGWTVADTGRLRVDSILVGDTGSLTEDVLRYILRRDDPPYGDLESPVGRIADPRLLSTLSGEPVTAWYRSPVEQNAIVVAAAPIARAGVVDGAVVLEQISDAILTTTNQALLRLLGVSLLAVAIAVIGMVGFATLLSVRVRRLAVAAETALGPKGEIATVVPGNRARDELGDLARSFSDLLERLREHTVYLRSLASKLSHELRTPLAVVSTSLDNLEREPEGSQSEQYMKRLREGADRLDAILVAMSEATRMEQAIADTSPEVFDLGDVVASCCRAYEDVYPDRSFSYAGLSTPVHVKGARELFAQLMDKLIDNAVSFSPRGSTIGIALSESGDELCLEVTNVGPLLPEKMRRQLFDSLVSVRPSGGARPHLGLGLYVAVLIAQFHGGRITADNLPDGSGVVFRTWLPRRA